MRSVIVKHLERHEGELADQCLVRVDLRDVPNAPRPADVAARLRLRDREEWGARARSFRVGALAA